MRTIGLRLCGWVLACALASPLDLLAQSQRPYRVGYLQTATREEQEPLTRAFEESMRALGYVEGRNVVYERRFADNNQERLPELAEELVRSGVDVIVTGGNPVVGPVKRATSRIPVVMSTSRDPVGSGFVQSLSRPGGNITGLTSDAGSEVQQKRVEILRQLVPRATRIGLLWNPLTPAAAYREQVDVAARKLGLSVISVEARRRDELEGAFAALARDKVEALVVMPDQLFFTARSQLAALAAAHRLPAIYHVREIAEAGGLASYGANLTTQFRRAAVFVDRILRGAKPGELAVEQSTSVELVINKAAADALGLAIPEALRLQADFIEGSSTRGRP